MMAWNVVRRLARTCELYVLTCDKNREAIEKAIEREQLSHLQFYCVGLSKWLTPLLRELVGQAWTPGTMARAASLSRSAFAERFRATMAMTPARFVTTIRMARAAEMLQHGSASIARIAEMAGYGSEAAFSRAFRKWSGSPPGALRRGAWTTDH